MDAHCIVLRGARNNAWANLRLYSVCERLSHDELMAARASFFPSIWATLMHNLEVDTYYLSALIGVGLAPPSVERFADMMTAQRATDLKLVGYIETLSLADLSKVVALPRETRTQHESVLDVLLHLYQHQIHHRGQVHAMLSETNASPPQLDEFYMREELPLRRHELQALGFPLE